MVTFVLLRGRRGGGLRRAGLSDLPWAPWTCASLGWAAGESLSTGPGAWGGARRREAHRELVCGVTAPLPGIEQVPEAAGCRAARGRVPQCDQGCRPGPGGRLGEPLVCGPGVRLHTVLGLPCLPRGTTASQQRLRGPQSSVCPTEEFLGLLQTGRQRTRVCLLTQAHTGGAGSGGKAARAPPCCYGDKAVPVL